MYPPPPPPLNHPAHNVGVDDEDGLTWVFTPPVLVEHGMFKGRWLRFALAVAQEPVLGRRKTEKDRRPLGPAPIVRFRAVECRRRRSEPGDWNEEEVDPSAIEPSHLICAAELAPPLSPAADSSSRPASAGLSRPSSSSAPGGKGYSKDLGGDVIMSERPTAIPVFGDMYQGGARDGDGDVDDVSMIEDDERMEFMVPSPRNSPHNSDDGQGHDPSAKDGQAPHNDDHSYQPGQRRDIADGREEGSEQPYGSFPSRPMTSRIDGILNHPATSTAGAVRSAAKKRSGEVKDTATSDPSIKAVRNLYGNLHVAGVRVPSPEGGMGTWFLFTDLSVRQEGTYSLRFRCFDLTAIGPSVGLPSPCLVECQSQPFRVYSPRQVPPLPRPTELADHFAKQGFKLNTRKNERTVSTPPPSAPPSASGSQSQQSGPTAAPGPSNASLSSTSKLPATAITIGSTGSTAASSASARNKVGTKTKNKRGTGIVGKAPESESQPALRPSIEPIQVDDSPNQSMKGSKGSTSTGTASTSTEMSLDAGFSTGTNSARATSFSTLSTMESIVLSGSAAAGAADSGNGSGSGSGGGGGGGKWGETGGSSASNVAKTDGSSGSGQGYGHGTGVSVGSKGKARIKPSGKGA
ncbi:hypothetical protein IAT40_000923 [Kwoniella sp. CBS 6097]